LTWSTAVAPTSANRAMMKKKITTMMSKTEAFKEVKNNPPAILAKTAKKSGAAQARKQAIAIALSKSGLSKPGKNTQK